MPQLFGEVELDLAEHGLITDLDHALDTHTWHFVRSAINRLLNSDTESWLKKEVRALVRCRIDRIQTADAGRGGVQAGREVS